MDINIPVIPQAAMNAGPQQIRWVKTVNDKDTNSAYIPPDFQGIPLNRVITTPDGKFFYLQVNSEFRASLKNVSIGEIILLHQRLDNQSVKCFTHLVTPIVDDVVDYPYIYPTHPNVNPGRLVKVIAMTGNQTANSIPVLQTMWQNMGFTGNMHDLSHQQGSVFEIPSNQQLPQLQNDIWNRFQPYIV